MSSLFMRSAGCNGYNSYNGYIGYYRSGAGLCRRTGLGDVVADLVEEVAEGGGIAGLDDGGEFGELGADGA